MAQQSLRPKKERLRKVSFGLEKKKKKQPKARRSLKPKRGKKKKKASFGLEKRIKGLRLEKA